MTSGNILRGIVDIFPRIIPTEFLSKQRRVKLGFDPTSDSLHLGHSILLRKLRAFQEEGHKPVVIIGDLTARIGDPTGRSTTRNKLSEGEIKENTKGFIRTLGKFLDPEKCEFRYNSDHFEGLRAEDLINLQSMMTVQQLLAKQDFSNRLEQNVPIGLHEFMYPLLQGYDSFKVESDIELGGVDQRFNVSIGRDVQKLFSSETLQIGMLMPILRGTDGTQKMSKSLNNTIGIDEHPLQMFSKLEKIPDCCVDDYILLLTDCDPKGFPLDPRKKQQKMAFEVVSTFHGKGKALMAKADSETLVLSKGIEGDKDINAPKVSIKGVNFPVKIPKLLKDVGIIESTSEVRRRIKAGSIRLNGVKITDVDHIVENEGVILSKLLQISRNDFFIFS